MEKTYYRSASWKADENGTIVGYPVVFEARTVLFKDPETEFEYGEIIDRHALDNADLSDVILRYDHAGHVLARTRNNTLTLKIDDHGLRIEADMTKSEEARKFYEEIRNGLIDKMSFAFTVAPDGDTWDKNTRTRRIRSINKLFDVSIVSRPAYEQTEVNARSSVLPYAIADNKDREIADLSMRAEATCKKVDVPIERYFPSGEETEGELLKGIIQNNSYDLLFCDDLDEARKLYEGILKAEATIKAAAEEEKRLRNIVAAGAGTVFETIPEERPDALNNYSRGNNTSMENTFYQDFMVKRTAASTGTLSAIIPTEVTDKFVVEKAPGAFLKYAQITSIDHVGTLKIPVASLVTVTAHTENNAVTDNGYVPATLDITHNEYIYKTGYSDLGMVVSAENFQNIVESVCLESAYKKLDGLCLDSISGFTFVDGTNAVEVDNGDAPTYAEFMELAGYLGSDYVSKAKWFMAPSTYFSWLLGLEDSANRPILDPTKKVEDQAFCGFGIELDAQIPDHEIYFGDAGRIHLNNARGVEIRAWDDLDYNQRKVAVRTVSGAAAETGCMVKMFETAATT